MLAFVITVLFTLTGIIAVVAIADSLIRARAAYTQLMRDAAMMQEDFLIKPVMQHEARLRHAPRRTIAERRPALRQPFGHRACAAA